MSGPTDPHESRVAGHLPGEPGARDVDLPDLLLETELAQAEPVGRERVGFQEIRPRVRVLPVDDADQVGVREVQLVEAPPDRHALGVDLGPHGAVADDDALGEGFQEIGHGAGL